MAKGSTGCLQNLECYKVLTFPVVVVVGGEKQRDGSVELDAGGIGGCESIHMFPRNIIL